MRETAVEFSMAANPNPDPYIAGAQRDRSKVSCVSYRPCVDRSAAVPIASSDAQDSAKTFRKRRER